MSEETVSQETVSQETTDLRRRWSYSRAETVFENKWLRLRRYHAIAPTGVAAQYTILSPKSIAVGVLPVDEDGGVHLVGQARFSTGGWSWEMPEGGGDWALTPEATAHRELAEESGLQAGRLLQVLHLHTSNSLLDEVAYCFLALDLSPAAGQKDDVELFERRRTPFREVLAEIGRGDITDAITVATVLRVHHMAVSGSLEPALARKLLE